MINKIRVYLKTIVAMSCALGRQFAGLQLSKSGGITGLVHTRRGTRSQARSICPLEASFRVSGGFPELSVSKESFRNMLGMRTSNFLGSRRHYGGNGIDLTSDVAPEVFQFSFLENVENQKNRISGFFDVS